MNKIILVWAAVIALGLAAVAPAYAWSIYPYTNTATYASCTNLTRDLSTGAQGGQVSQLQTFLVNQNYSGGGSWMVTGYFGRATAVALTIFQGQHGLPQTGELDAAMRAAIYQVSCGGTYNSNYANYPYLYYPNTTYNYNTYPYSYNNYNSYYPYNYNNTYPYNYNYGYNNNCDVNYAYLPMTGWYGYNNCGVNNINNNPASIALSYLTPTSGAVGDTVTVYGHGFSTTGNTVHFGIGIMTNLISTDGRAVTFQVPTQLSGYGSQTTTLGMYNVSVTNSQGYTSGTLPFTVTSLGAAGQPSITNVSGPTSLAAGTTGTWSLQVYNPGSNYLSVSVNWGDQYQYGATGAQAPQTLYQQGTQYLTFTHAYYAAGTYTITFTATNANGASTVSTATVTVTGTGTTYGTPTISSLYPTVGPVGSTVTIYGTGFSQWGNTVRFGNGAITNVSSNGSVITFTVPTYLSPYCVGNVACPMYAQVVTLGAYPVSVINGNGITSNALTFTVQ